MRDDDQLSVKVGPAAADCLVDKLRLATAAMPIFRGAPPRILLELNRLS